MFFYRWMLFALVGLAGLTQAAPLTFKAALDLAERESPNIAAQTAAANAAQSAAIPAGALPDPKLLVGVDNLPVTGSNSWSISSDFMTMRKIGVMQEIPNSDKRRARIAAAEASVDTARTQRRAEQFKVRRDTALAWINRYYLERKRELLEDLDRENRLFADAVRAQIAANRGQVVDTVMPKQEAAELADRRDELVRDLTKANAVLRRFVGAEAEEPLAGDPPQLNIDADVLRQHLHQHPELETFASEARMAEAQVREAEAMKKSDWGVELAYERRGSQFSDMVSVQVTFDLPVFTKTRQDPQIAAKQQAVTKINAERDATLREHTSELENGLAEYNTLTRQLDRANHTLLPLAQEKVDLQYASYKAGKNDLTAVITARRELINQRLKVIDVTGQREAVAVKLYYTYEENAQ